MDYLSTIRRPIEAELQDFIELFNESLEHDFGYLQQALDHIRQRAGKRMRPILTLLMAKNFGEVNQVSKLAAVGLELLHTASLVHDDVVDESSERRGQASVNAIFDNKVSVLVGDYILSTSLLYVSKTHHISIVRYLSELGRTLADGEIMQLNNVHVKEFSEESYYQVIRCKTAALFETCAKIGALSVGATEKQVNAAAKFGEELGIIFQIRDDIFDYYDSQEIGKPTGNDMAEGKLTLPVLHCLLTTDDEAMKQLAYKVKEGGVTPDEIAVLVDFTKRNGGIEYAEQKMEEFHQRCMGFIDEYVTDADIREALTAYLDFVIRRDK